MENTVIMYCPLNDGHIIRMIEEQTKKYWRGKGKIFPYKVKLIGETPFQNLICDELPEITVEDSEIFSFDKIAGTKKDSLLFKEFSEKNKMELNIPEIPESDEETLYFAVIAVMDLKANWDAKHHAKKYKCDISAEDSYSKQELNIKGYILSNVKLALDDRYEKAISACIQLNKDIDIRINDVTTFGKKREILESIKDEKSLYEIITEKKMFYSTSGYMIAPCVEEKMVIKDHLKDISWRSDDLLFRTQIDSSEALTKLKLNEKGVEAHAETIASCSTRVTACRDNIEKTFVLIIEHGLIIDIRYKNEPIFIAYIPQKNFKLL